MAITMDGSQRTTPLSSLGAALAAAVDSDDLDVCGAGSKFREADGGRPGGGRRHHLGVAEDCSARQALEDEMPASEISTTGSGASAWRSTSGAQLTDMEASSPEASVADELLREFPLAVRHALSGAILTRVSARSTDTVAQLREVVFRECGEVGVAVRLLFQSQALEPPSKTLEEAGVGFERGDIFVVLTPLRCLTTALDGTVRIRHLHSGVQLLMDIGARVWNSALAPGGTTLLMIDTNAEGSLWCAETGTPLCNLEENILTCSFSADGSRFAGASDECMAGIWCADSGSCLHALTGHTDDVKSATFSPDGQLVATASSDGTARLFDAATGACSQVLVGHLDVVMSAEFSPDGRFLATASMDGTARLWSRSSGECLRVLAGHTKPVEHADFSPDGEQVLTRSFDGTARIWQAATGECHLSLSGDGSVVKSAAFSPDGAKVAIASGSERIKLFDTQTGGCCAIMVGHEDWVCAVRFSEDGALLASASYDGTARIWSASTGECLQTLSGHQGAVLSADFFAG